MGNFVRSAFTLVIAASIVYMVADFARDIVGSNPEGDYLEVVRPEVSVSLASDATLIERGRDACRVLDQLKHPEEMSPRIAVGMDFTEDQAGWIVYAATHSLCTDHEEMFDFTGYEEVLMRR